MTFTHSQLITQAREEVDFWRERDELIPSQQTAIRLRLAEITLAALTAEPDYYVVVTSAGVWQAFRKTREEAELIVTKPFNPGYSIREIYTSPPAPRVPDGYALVPVELLESLRSSAHFEKASYAASFGSHIDTGRWKDEYEELEKVCTEIDQIIAAAPQQEVK